MDINLQHNLTISDLFRGDLKLASTPNIYFKLQEVIDDPNKSLVDAAFIIEKDATLSMKLLKIVNSAFYGFPSKIASIDRAITMIGTKELQTIALSTAVIDNFSDIPDNLMSMHDFWARGLRCALIAQGIDEFLGQQHTDAIFVCGILHHIGQLIFYRRIPELAREVNSLVQDKEIPTDEDEIKAEVSVIGFDHYQTGAELVKLWKLPEIIYKSIHLHTAPTMTDSHGTIAAIIKAADTYSKMDTLFAEFDPLEHLEISPEDMEKIIDQAHEKFEEIFRIFYSK